ncbi:MAG: hypothetical protein ACFB2X_02985 [Rivularia sp. (in: cyanobacteria)]
MENFQGVCGNPVELVRKIPVNDKNYKKIIRLLIFLPMKPFLRNQLLTIDSE